MYDDEELLQRFRFPHRELLDVIDDFEDDVTFKLKPFSSTLSMVRGTLSVACKASVMFVHALAFF